MNIKSIAATAAGLGLLAVASPSFASPVTLTFEGANSFGSIADFYNGGTDIPANLSSSTPASGTNYNISFGLDALALSNDADFTYFSNAPSATVMTPVGGSASLSATGAFSFIDALSFTYSASSAFTIKVLDAANNVLQTVSLAATNDSCTDVAFCVWTQASLSFSGAAKSFDFGDATYVAGFDNITVNEVPLPAAGWLLASGLALFRRRKPAVA